MCLNREKILSLKPGRELDALIAVHVFGWVWLTSHRDGLCGLFHQKEEYRWNWGPTTHRQATDEEAKSKRYCDWHRDVTYYSTTWEGMGLVVEKMRCRFSEIHITQSPRGWVCLYADYMTRKMVEGPFCVSAPTAVCKAALLAILPPDTGVRMPDAIPDSIP